MKKVTNLTMHFLIMNLIFFMLGTLVKIFDTMVFLGLLSPKFDVNKKNFFSFSKNFGQKTVVHKIDSLTLPYYEKIQKFLKLFF